MKPARGRAPHAPWWLVLAGLLAATPAAAVRIAEFGTACADGTGPVSFIELSGNANEPFDRRIGIRTLDRSGAILWEVPDVYGGFTGSQAPTSWYDGNRRLGVVTPQTVDRLAPGGGLKPDLTLGVPLDPIGGSIILFRANTNGSSTTVDRIDYGAGRAIPAPPAGTSTLRVSSSWRIEPSPKINLFSMAPGGGLPWSSASPGCLGVPTWAVSGLLTRCEDGSLGGQYLQLVARAAGAIDSRIRIRVLDHSGQPLGEFGPFDGASGPFVAGQRWLIGGPDFRDIPSGGGANQDLPFSLDPIGGTIEIGGTFAGIPWVHEVFTYGTSEIPAPTAGYAWDRPLGQALRMVSPAPINFGGSVTFPPGCAVGSGRSSFYFRELSIACVSGATDAQFVELGILGTGVLLDATYELRALDRHGVLTFSIPNVFAPYMDRLLRPADAILFATQGARVRAADVVLPSPIDPIAGTLMLARNVGGVVTTVATLPYGDGPRPRPFNGTSLATEDGAAYRIQSYPTPTGLQGPAPLLDCEYRDGPAAVVVEEIGTTCRDGSHDGVFLELHAASGTHAEDMTLGLDVVTGSGSTAKLYPLFPLGTPAIPLGGDRLLASEAFAARTNFAPDQVLPPLSALPREIRVFRRDPVTAVDRVLETITIPSGSLAPGHGLARGADGRYGEIVGPRPTRGDGATLEDSDCFAEPRPDAIRIRELLLRCRDGGTNAQYVELESASPDAVTSPGLSLRAFDHANRELFDVPVPPVWPGSDEPVWPQGIVLLAGGARAGERYGMSTDLALPTLLDTLGGFVELVLRAHGAEQILDALTYGTPAMPAPPAGASLSRTPEGFVLDPRPTPENTHGELARRECLGVCASRELFAGDKRRYAGSDASASARYADAAASYDAARGVFRLASGASRASGTLPDRFRLVGAPAGTPLAPEIRVSLATSLVRTCRDAVCVAPRASLDVRAGDLSESTALTEEGVRELTWTRDIAAGEDFDVELAPAVFAGGLTGEQATLAGRLSFAGLPEGVRVVSCLGFDSERARPVRDATIERVPDGVRIVWPVDPLSVASVTLERSDRGGWRALETRTPDASGTLEFLDSRADAGREHAYRLRWDDAFGAHVTAPVSIRIDARPGFALEGVHPNPSAGVFAARVQIPEAGVVRLEALDVAGRVVASQQGWRAAGMHLLPIARAGRLAPGVYVVRLHYRGLVARTTAIVLR